MRISRIPFAVCGGLSAFTTLAFRYPQRSYNCRPTLHLTACWFQSSTQISWNHHAKYRYTRHFDWNGNRHNSDLFRFQIGRRCFRNAVSLLNSVDAARSTFNESDSVGTKSRKKSKFEIPTFRLFYNDVYEVNLPPRHRFPMGKYRKVREMVQNKIGSLPASVRESVNSDFCVSPLATFEELSSTHDPTYIKRFLEGDQTEKEQRNVGFPWSTEGVDRALSSVGGTLAAACFVCEHERARRSELVGEGAITNSSAALNSNRSSFPAWAAHIAGGTHHAFYDYGEGFSVFSDMAVAANVVLDKYPDVIQNNILMIDLDVHQGNGNAVLFQTPKERASLNQNKKHREEGTYHNNSDRVFTFSMHCSGNYFSQKQDSDLDIELPIGCKDNAYLMTLNHWLNRFKRVHLQADESSREQPSSSKPHRWDLIIFQAGVDVLDDDRLGRMALSQKGVKRRNELVYKFASDLGIPLVICMGGGYPKNDDGWDSIIETHSDVYFGAHEFLSSLSLD